MYLRQKEDNLDIDKQQYADIFAQVIDGIEPEGANAEAFVIDSDEKVAWYTGKLESLYQQIKIREDIANKKKKALTEIYQNQMDMIDASFIAEVAEYRNGIQGLMFRFANQVREFITDKISNKKTRSLKYGGCQIGYKKEADKLVILNKEEVIDWAISNNLDSTVLNIETNISMRNLDDYRKTHGEIPVGTKVIEGSDNFYIKVGNLDLYASTMNQEKTNEQTGRTGGESQSQ